MIRRTPARPPERLESRLLYSATTPTAEGMAALAFDTPWADSDVTVAYAQPTGGTTWQQVGTAAPAQTALAVGGLDPALTYNFAIVPAAVVATDAAVPAPTLTDDGLAAALASALPDAGIPAPGDVPASGGELVTIVKDLPSSSLMAGLGDFAGEALRYGGGAFHPRFAAVLAIAHFDLAEDILTGIVDVAPITGRTSKFAPTFKGNADAYIEGALQSFAAVTPDFLNDLVDRAREKMRGAIDDVLRKNLVFTDMTDVNEDGSLYFPDEGPPHVTILVDEFGVAGGRLEVTTDVSNLDRSADKTTETFQLDVHLKLVLDPEFFGIGAAFSYGGSFTLFGTIHAADGKKNVGAEVH